MAGKSKPNATIKPGTPEMEAFLAAGYPDIATRENANLILEAWKKNPQAYPYETVQKARAFLAALDTTAVPVSTDTLADLEKKYGYKEAI